MGKNQKKSYYVGYTSNLTRRITQHKNGNGARYTKNKRMIKLSYVETYTTRSDALKRETALKRMSRKKKAVLAKEYSSLPNK